MPESPYKIIVDTNLWVSYVLSRKTSLLGQLLTSEAAEVISSLVRMGTNLKFPFDVTIRLRSQGGATEEKPARVVEIDPKSESGKAIHLGVVEQGRNALPPTPNSPLSPHHFYTFKTTVCGLSGSASASVVLPAVS